MLKPGSAAPILSVPRLGAGTLDLASQTTETFLVFYRGLHCPACRKQLEGLQPLQAEFAARGIEVWALSMDEEARAREAAETWAIGGLPLGFGMPEAMARDWGLWISERVVEKEPPRFSEAALSWIGADGVVLAHWQNSVPFGRPPFQDILSGIDFVRANGRPPRGAA